MERQLLLNVATSCADGHGVLIRASWIETNWRIVCSEEKISCDDRTSGMSGWMFGGVDGGDELCTEENVDLGEE